MSKKISTILVIIFVIGTLLVFSNTFSFKSTNIDLSDAKPLNTNWNDSDSGVVFDLPTDLDLDANIEHSFSTILPHDFNHPQVILIRGSLQDVIVKLDGIMIYSYDLRDESNSIPYASLWHYISVPKDSQGLELEITLHSPFKSMSGMVNDVFYGSENDLNVHILLSYGGRFILGLAALFMGVLFVILSLFVDKIKDNDVMYIGFFGIAMAIWMIAESRTLQFFIDSQYIHGSLAYIMLALAPIPMIVYVKQRVLPRFKKTYLTIVYLYLVQLLTVIVLQALGVVGFFESVIATQISIALGILFTISLLIYEFKKFPDRKVLKRFIFYFAVLTMIIIVEIFTFSSKDFDMISIYIQWIAISFILMLFVRYVYVIMVNNKDKIKNEALEELVYQDRITGAKNRHAFEEDLDRIFNEEHLRKSLSIAYFDFDDLKMINDTYGHLTGDQILKEGYEIINSVFGKHGTCYRIGGDEFSCLLKNESLVEYNKKIKVLMEKIEIHNSDKEYTVSISHGLANYNEKEDFKPSDLIKRADKKMYEQKNSKLKKA
ncbi:MAG: diguanylate cyclase [Acholeplasmataceae bacterium]|nr:diguanylate cyclase [Acholeplasmataceae bacterium]